MSWWKGLTRSSAPTQSVFKSLSVSGHHDLLSIYEATMLLLIWHLRQGLFNQGSGGMTARCLGPKCADSVGQLLLRVIGCMQVCKGAPNTLRGRQAGGQAQNCRSPSRSPLQRSPVRGRAEHPGACCCSHPLPAILALCLPLLAPTSPPVPYCPDFAAMQAGYS